MKTSLALKHARVELSQDGSFAYATVIRDCSLITASRQGRPARTKTLPSKTFCLIGRRSCRIHGSGSSATANSRTIPKELFTSQRVSFLKQCPFCVVTEPAQNCDGGTQVKILLNVAQAMLIQLRVLPRHQHLIQLPSPTLTSNDPINHLAGPKAPCGKMRMHCSMTASLANPIARWYSHIEAQNALSRVA